MGQKHSGLPHCNSRPVISAEPAHHNRVESPLHSTLVNLIFRLWGTLVVDMFATVHNLPQSSPVYISSSGATSTGDRCSVTRQAGAVNVQVSTVSTAQQSYSEAQDDPGGRGDTHSRMLAISTVVFTLTMSVCGPPSNSFRPAESYCYNSNL